MWNWRQRGHQTAAREVGVKMKVPEIRLPDSVGYEHRP